MPRPDIPSSSLFGTAFSFLLVLVFTVFMAFTSVRTYVLYGNYTGLTDHFNTIGVIFLIFWIVVISLILRLRHPLLGLSPANFAQIYAALMVAVVLPSMGFGGYFIPLIAGAFYYATPENNWSDLLWPHIPHWAAPRDLESIRQLFEGADAGTPVPWDLWAGPLLWWGLFMLAFFFVSVALISLVHHQWSRQERLVYPLAAVPNMLLDSLEHPARSILKSKLLWLGFFFAWMFPTVNMIDQVFDLEVIHGFGIPSYRIEFRRIGLTYGLNTDLLVVGLSYLVNLNVLFSVWFFHLVIAAEGALLGWLGITLTLPGQPHFPNHVLLMGHQQVGSLLGIVAISLWISRDFLRRQWQQIIRGGADPHNPISPRIAALLGLIGLVYMTGFLYMSGLSLIWSIVFLLLALALFFAIARLLAQTGIGRLRAPTSVPPVMTNICGTAPFGAQGLTAMGLSMVWTADLQLFLMGTLRPCLQGLRTRPAQDQRPQTSVLSHRGHGRRVGDDDMRLYLARLSPRPDPRLQLVFRQLAAIPLVVGGQLDQQPQSGRAASSPVSVDRHQPDRPAVAGPIPLRRMAAAPGGSGHRPYQYRLD